MRISHRPVGSTLSLSHSCPTRLPDVQLKQMFSASEILGSNAESGGTLVWAVQ